MDSSRIAGVSGSDLEESILIFAEPTDQGLGDLGLVIDELGPARVEWVLGTDQDAQDDTWRRHLAGR